MLGQKDFILAYMITTTFDGKRYDARKHSPYDKFKKDLLWLAKQNGKKIQFTLEGKSENEEKFYKELVQNAPKDIRGYLAPSHIDIYTANPPGQPFRERVEIASKIYREVLKKRWLEYPAKSRQGRLEARAALGAMRSSNQFVQGMIEALASMK